MGTDRIDFISEYCDRWCERCAFTGRCSAFAVQVAEGMCGDWKDALELAVGAPQPVGPERPLTVPEWVEELNEEPSAEADRQHERRHGQIESSPIMALAWACTGVAWPWLAARRTQQVDGGDPVLAEALDIAAYDIHFITAKLARAIGGRLEYRDGESDEIDPVQNDWNGSAKVALISIERSAHAWRTIAQALRDETAAMLADQMAALRREVEAEFPAARSFVRPGFDEPWR